MSPGVDSTVAVPMDPRGSNPTTQLSPSDWARLRRITPVALLGATIEWYDFFIYATAAALVFPKLFFPADTPDYVASIASFSTLAVGMVARPLGAALFGHIGDRHGRKKALVIAMITMGAASTAIGLLPTFATIGIAAPLALTLMRLLQGLAVGGQWGGAMLLITESAPPNRRGYYGGFAQIGVPAGVIASNLAFLILTTLLPVEAFMAWGWRVPFLLSIALIAVAMFAQLRIEDHPEFNQSAVQPQGRAQARRSPAIEVLRSHPRQVWLAAGAFAIYIAYFYVLVSYVVQYATTQLGMQRNVVLMCVLIGAGLQVGSVILSASASDRYGRRVVYLVGVVLLLVWAFPCFLLIETGSFWGMLVALGIGQLFMGISYGPQAALFSELFAKRVRYSGASLGYQFGSIIGGAFAPIIATALSAATGTSTSVALYLTAVGVLSLISTLLIKETSLPISAEPECRAHTHPTSPQV